MTTLFAIAVRFTFLIRVLLLMAVANASGFADTVSLTHGPPFTFVSGSDLYVRFSVWNYGANNRDSSPYPTSVGLQLLGAQPDPGQLTSLPNSTAQYFLDYRLLGWLENGDGSVSTPFTNPIASQLGLVAGSLLLGPGLFNSGTTSVATIEADAALTLTLSEQIFGPDVADRGSSAIIHLRNVGKDLQVGLDGERSLLSAISEPSISGRGSVQTSGITQALTVTSVPEPSSFVLLSVTVSVLLTGYITRWRTNADERE